MLHSIARKFARVCPNEGSDCSRSTSMFAQLKNSLLACAILLDSNRSCDIAMSNILLTLNYKNT